MATEFIWKILLGQTAMTFNSPHPEINYYVQRIEGLGLNGIELKWIIGTHGNWKNQNPGGQIGGAGSSRPVLRILFFSIFLGAEYSFYVKYLCPPKKSWHKNSFLGSV